MKRQNVTTEMAKRSIQKKTNGFQSTRNFHNGCSFMGVRIALSILNSMFSCDMLCKKC